MMGREGRQEVKKEKRGEGGREVRKVRKRKERWKERGRESKDMVSGALSSEQYSYTLDYSA